VCGLEPDLAIMDNGDETEVRTSCTLHVLNQHTFVVPQIEYYV